MRCCRWMVSERTEERNPRPSLTNRDGGTLRLTGGWVVSSSCGWIDCSKEENYCLGHPPDLTKSTNTRASESAKTEISFVHSLYPERNPRIVCLPDFSFRVAGAFPTKSPSTKISALARVDSTTIFPESADRGFVLISEGAVFDCAPSCCGANA